MSPLKIGLFQPTQYSYYHCSFPFTFLFLFFPPLSHVLLCYGYFPILSTHVHRFPLSPYPASYTLLTFIYESFQILHIPEIILTFKYIIATLPPLFEILTFLLNELTIAHLNLHNYSRLLWVIIETFFFFPCSSFLFFVEGERFGGLLSQGKGTWLWGHLYLTLLTYWALAHLKRIRQVGIWDRRN